MPKVGDRVIIEGSKIGQQRREGSLVGITGRLLNVRWSDGSTSLLTPGAGSVRFLPGKGKSANGAGTRKQVVKKPSAKKAPVKKNAVKKSGVKKNVVKASKAKKGKKK